MSHATFLKFVTNQRPVPATNKPPDIVHKYEMRSPWKRTFYKDGVQRCSIPNIKQQIQKLKLVSPHLLISSLKYKLHNAESSDIMMCPTKVRVMDFIG